jgi:hypothetical protein
VRALTGPVAVPLLAVVEGSGSASDPGYGVGPAAADYDGDGRPDLVAVNSSGCGTARGEEALYRNIGSLSFENAAAGAGLGGAVAHAAAWGDTAGRDPGLS